MKHYSSFLLLISFCLLFTSCKRSITGEGALVKQNRTDIAFDKIELDIPAKVTVIIADSTSIVVVAQQNLQEYIVTKSEGDALVISASRSIKPTKPIEIVMTCPPMKGLTVNGSGEIFIINSFKTEKLNLEINGSGDIHAFVNTNKIISNINGSGDLHLKGKGDIHTLEINGSGKLNAGELVVENYKIKINGSGDADVNVTSKLSVKITGSGNVRYKGQPDIENEIIGSGELKKGN